jgi:hypothetical protein
MGLLLRVLPRRHTSQTRGLITDQRSLVIMTEIRVQMSTLPGTARINVSSCLARGSGLAQEPVRDRSWPVRDEFRYSTRGDCGD